MTRHLSKGQLTLTLKVAWLPGNVLLEVSYWHFSLLLMISSFSNENPKELQFPSFKTWKDYIFERSEYLKLHRKAAWEKMDLNLNGWHSLPTFTVWKWLWNSRSVTSSILDAFWTKRHSQHVSEELSNFLSNIQATDNFWGENTTSSSLRRCFLQFLALV